MSNIAQRRIRSTQKHKRKNPKRAGQLPYGWKTEIVNSQQTNNPAKDESEQKIIKTMQDFRIKKYSYQRIADTLNANDIQTRKGTRWQKQYIHNILTANPISKEQ